MKDIECQLQKSLGVCNVTLLNLLVVGPSTFYTKDLHYPASFLVVGAQVLQLVTTFLPSVDSVAATNQDASCDTARTVG